MAACAHYFASKTAAMYTFRPLPKILVALTLSGFFSPPQISAQSATGMDRPESDTIHGVVVNSVTHQAIGRALVYSTDSRYAAMTDSQGRFEFTFPRSETGQNQNPNAHVRNGQQFQAIPNQDTGRPYWVTARKVGFLTVDDPVDISQITSPEQGVTISLTPEAHIVGHVILPGSDGSDKIALELYRHSVRNGQEHWDAAANVATRADGGFRFAELAEGDYKVLTLEMLDRDPITFKPGGQMYGYPPLYYPGATDFATAATIHLAAGEMFELTISPVKRAYYPVKLGFTNAITTPQIAVHVWPQGHPGPGFSLGYDMRDQSIQGLLPDGTYTVQATTFGAHAMSGTLNVTVSGSPLTGPAITLAPATSIAVNVREEFEHSELRQEPTGEFYSGISIGGPRSYSNPRRPNYLQVILMSEDPFGFTPGAGMRPPTGPEDETLIIENVYPGRFHVSVNSSRGYAAAITCGGTDLIHQPLVVGVGTSTPPIEITMRDDGAEVDGTLELPKASTGATAPNNPGHPVGFVYLSAMGRIDEPKVAWVQQDPTFKFAQIAPGTYRIFAVARQRAGLADVSDELLNKYGIRPQIIRLEAGQKEHLRLSLADLTE
jgi:hypothetical protein